MSRQPQFELTRQGSRAVARLYLQEARAICRAQPGYGTPRYRGDPPEAVALYQCAERALGRSRPLPRRWAA